MGLGRGHAAAGGVHRLDRVIVRRVGGQAGVAVGGRRKRRAAVDRRAAFAAAARAAVDVVAGDGPARGGPSQVEFARRGRDGDAQAGRCGG